jgi:tRNA modification GTPase
MVRLSGPDAMAIGRQIFHSDIPLGDRIRFVEFGRVLNANQEEIDSALAWVFKGPKSYTGEDTVEISTHGSVVVLESLVGASIAAGATLAQPGEFTRRAFVNGNIDLMQAEAVVDLIQSESRGGMSAAYAASSGLLSKQVHQVKEMVVQALSWIEVGLDFVDEDLEPIQQQKTMDLLADAQARIGTLVSTFEGARRRREGHALVLLGKPNAGKSTLLNALVGEDRAIVASAPGTTRDTVEARTVWRGETVRLVDTAGIRADEKDPVEREGIDRTWRAAGDADCVLVVLDCTEPWDQADSEMISRLNGTPVILVVNKCDLQNEMTVPAEVLDGRQLFEVCARDGSGLDQLSEATAQRLSQTRNHQSIGLTRQRHHDLLTSAARSIGEAATSMDRDGLPECASAALREGLLAIGEVLGENVDEAILDKIFSEFCIGK